MKVSQIEAKHIATANARLRGLRVYGDNIYWLETNSAEQGRSVLMVATRTKQPKPVLPRAYSVKTAINGYGGGDYCVGTQGIYFCNAEDQRWYAYANETCSPITPIADIDTHYGDPSLSADYIFLVRTRYSEDAQLLHEIVAISLAPPHILTVICCGADFYSSPRINKTGDRLAWIEWQHPHMPWDETTLCIALWDGHRVSAIERWHQPSVSQLLPLWQEDSCYFLSDQSGYWQLMRYQARQCTSITQERIDFALAPWTYHQQSYDFLDAETIVIVAHDNAHTRLCHINCQTQKITSYDTNLSHFSGYCCAYPGGCVLLAACRDELPAVYFLASQQSAQRINRPRLTFDTTSLAVARAFTFDNHTGDSVFGFFYAPTRLRDELPPPFLVMVHSGPTAHDDTGLNMALQFFTQRGFAVICVNYSGSTGYGRAYRQRLWGRWGELDVTECTLAARYCVAQGWVNAAAGFIYGSSSGGLTALMALCKSSDFMGAISAYGVTDLSLLAESTHKFERHYTDKLVGPWPSMRARYQQRSPLHRVDDIVAPVLLLHGACDKIVPLAQAQQMAHALARNNIRHELVIYPEEGHGFKRLTTIVDRYERTLAFMHQILDVSHSGASSQPNA